METNIYFNAKVQGSSVLHVALVPESKRIHSRIFRYKVFLPEKPDFKWSITRTYQEFIELHGNLKSIPELRDQIPELPTDLDFKNSSEENQLLCLEAYLTEILKNESLRNLPCVWEFFEVSVLSFTDTTKKRKEGYVDKRTGGRVGNEQHCFNCTKHCKRLQRRWLIVRDNMVGYLSNHMRGNLHEVLMFKGRFEVVKGIKQTGYNDGILISTNNRNFTFRAGSEQKMEEWFSEIKSAKEESEWQSEEHRYESSFPIRKKNKVRWYVDGIYYYNEVCEKLLRAQREVFITDWWLSPELYLKRPSNKYPNSQVVEVLGTIADRGVSVFIHVYKEVSFALTLNSLHTKNSLQKRNVNIKVVRHPHRSVVGGEFLWSHHEKIVCIDQEIAFIGGLDLCYGRMDTQEHRLVDCQEPYWWNGIDYSNAREADFVNVQDWQADSVNRQEIPRMPWHDIAVEAVGKVASDIAMHFVELWNHVMTDITGNYHKDKIILRPRTGASNLNTIRETLDEEDKAFNDDFTNSEPVLSISRSKTSFHGKPQKKNSSVQRGNSEIHKRINVAELDMKIENPENDPKAIPIDAMSPKLKKSYEERESLLEGSGSLLGDARNDMLNRRSSIQVSSIEDRSIKARLEDEDEKKIYSELEADMKEGDEAWARNLLMPGLKELGEVGTCECQVIRSAGTWSLGLERPEHSIHTAYLNLIDEADHFIYIENQFFISSTAGNPVKNSIAQALVDRIKIAALNKEKFKVIVVLPLLPGFSGGIDEAAASVLRIQLHWLYATISRGENSILKQLLSDPNISDPSDYISFYGLRNHALLNKKPVTEIVYVHSKLMIIDDEKVIIGSANINDRSQVGGHDSEIAMVISDQDKLMSKLAGNTRAVSKLAFTLRTNIFKEILGISDENILRDPLSQEFTHFIRSISQSNTRIYKNVFRCYPDNEIQSLRDLGDFESSAKLEDYFKYKNDIRGFIVDFPLHFLHDEDLRIKIFSKEYYIPEESFI
ncbi:hypothetical protein SteCoe_5508 [Stentor coeruleus]|uniref:Phospholipase n=1 Tax=Stentor coeruleus TaxID=5963 RepID=A0A1R2CS40_9CILI|nr:hypothetical protein SteCoe_5508 [Stentor coeruleus]